MTHTADTALTAEREAGIREREADATPGPWGTYDDGTGRYDIAADLEDTGSGFTCRRQIAQTVDEPIDNDPAHREWTGKEDDEQIAADTEFIAHAREDVPTLLAEIDRLRAEATDVSQWAMQLDEASLTPQEPMAWYGTTTGWELAVQFATTPTLTDAARDELLREIRTAVDTTVKRVLKAKDAGPKQPPMDPVHILGMAQAERPIVAYRNPDRPSVLLCREHGGGWEGLTPLTSEDLPDGGLCTWGRPGPQECGADVLIAADA